MREPVQSVEEFKERLDLIANGEGYKDPIMFGICRNDMGTMDTSAVLQSTFLVSNIGANLGSAKIFKDCLTQEAAEGETILSNEVHVSENEAVFNIDLMFLNKALDSFKPYLENAKGDAHLNVQVVKLLKKIYDDIAMNPQSLVPFGSGPITYRVVFIYADTAVETVEAGYLKLYALSGAKAELRSLNLNGLFGKLTNCAWLASGEPVELNMLREREMELKALGRYPSITHVDKFPRMLQHIIPADNTRILDTSKVRMGAQLAAGTTVMPGASYINFNAGTLGAVMVEGRISSSAIVGADSDIGGGASILGVLSGTDGDPISVGERCLLGANSTCGVSLGDACIIDAGIAILPGTKVTMYLEDFNNIFEVNNENIHAIDLNKIIVEAKWTTITIKAGELSGYNGLHYRQNSITGVFTVARSTREVKLNAELH